MYIQIGSGNSGIKSSGEKIIKKETTANTMNTVFHGCGTVSEIKIDDIALNKYSK